MCSIYPSTRAGLTLSFCESAIAFVADKRRAIQECVRVAKPGGYVGLNESFWIEEPPPEIVARARASRYGCSNCCA